MVRATVSELKNRLSEILDDDRMARWHGQGWSATMLQAVRLHDNGCMVKSVEGVYRNGRVELLEPLGGAEGSRVIVTWVQPVGSVDLRERGIEESQAADLRNRLAAFAEDWDRAEMAVYDELPAR